jgi:hypothetical protein
MRWTDCKQCTASADHIGEVTQKTDKKELECKHTWVYKCVDCGEQVAPLVLPPKPSEENVEEMISFIKDTVIRFDDRTDEPILIGDCLTGKALKALAEAITNKFSLKRK